SISASASTASTSGIWKSSRRTSVEIALVLGVPLLGALLLALAGHRSWAPELNAAMSFATFFATTLLTARVIAGGTMVWLDERFIVDPSKVLLVALAGLLREQDRKSTRLNSSHVKI